MWNYDSTGTPDGTLSSSYLNDHDDGTAGTITVTGIPYAEYKVIVYHATDTGTGFAGVTVNGALQADCAYGTEGAASWPTVGGWVEGANCRVVDNVTGSTLTIDLGARAGYVRSTAAGIQIVSTTTSTPPAPVLDLMIAGPVAGGTGMELSWTGENGKPYGVETNANLLAEAGWQSYTSGLMGAGTTITITNAIGTEGQLFYRVISE